MKRKYDDTLITTFEIISTDNNFKYIVNNNYTKLWHTNTDLTHVNFPNKDRIEIYLTKIILTTNNIEYNIDLKYRDDLLNFISMK